ncbi:hypothetical protein PINS_up006376 [Pythium insidiosum]|nr:hypothetical protein PINS_up006376 [Pythium insidiosum]
MVSRSLPRFRIIQDAAATSRFRVSFPTQLDLDLCRCSATGSKQGSLLGLLDHTRTAFGARRLRDWLRSPLASLPEIRQRQNVVRFLTTVSSGRVVLEDLTERVLRNARDLERDLQGIHLGTASPQAIARLLRALDIVRDLPTILQSEENTPSMIQSLATMYPSLDQVIYGIQDVIDVAQDNTNSHEHALVERFWNHIPDLASQFEGVFAQTQALEREQCQLLERYRDMTQLPELCYLDLRMGASRDVERVLCVPRGNTADVIPPEWLMVNATDSSVRFTTRELLALRQLHEELQTKQAQLLSASWKALLRHIDGLVYVDGMRVVEILATLDALCSLATVAWQQPGCVAPEFVDEGRVLRMESARHPVLDSPLYVPTTIDLCGDDDWQLLISGPNMGGKSTLLRMVGCIVILAHIGAFVPAKRVMLSVFDSVLSCMQRQGDCSLLIDRSDTKRPRLHVGTGGSATHEAQAISRITQLATPRSLVLLDEVGFGLTSSQAMALASATVKYLQTRAGCLVLLSTHMTQLLNDASLRVQGRRVCMSHHVIQSENTVVFSYRPQDGVVAKERFALQAAELAGLPQQIIIDAATAFALTDTHSN